MDSAENLWIRIRAALEGAAGTDYFRRGMKGRLVPGSDIGVGGLKGTVLSATPHDAPQVLLLSMSGATTPEVTLTLEAPMREPLPTGTRVEFEGIATGFAPRPFMVTFHVPSGKLSVARGE